MKKYSMLAAGLSLALGSAIASADGGYGSTSQQPAHQQAPSSTMNTTQPTTTTTTTAQATNITPVDFLFETNSATLKPEAQAQLNELATWVKCTPKGTLILEGHADPRGTQAHNMELSANRAAAVRQKLIEMGVGQDRIVLTIYGENGPKRATFAEDRRVTVRSSEGVPQGADIVATR